MILKWFTLLLVLAKGFEAIHAETLTKATHFDNYLEVLSSARDFVEKLRIVEAVWGQIRVETPVNLLRVQTLYQQLQRRILNEAKNLNQQQAASELQQEIRRHLVHRNAQLLANSLNGPNFANGTEVQQFCGYLTKNYEHALVLDIYEKAIDEIYNFRKTESLAAQLKSIYRKNSQLTAYEIMVESQLYLFWKFHNRRDINDLYLFNVAYYFSGIQEDNLYQQLRNSTKQRLGTAITALPTSLQFLFFKPSFCLLNKAYSEFIYTASIFIDSDRQRVLTWRVPNSVASNGIWVKNLTEVSAGNPTASLSLEFSLKSLTEDNFMYMESSVSDLPDMFLSWRSGNARQGSTLSLQLVENQLVLSQNGFLMCVNSTGIYDTNRRYVHGYGDSEHTPEQQECQWIAKACSIIME